MDANYLVLKNNNFMINYVLENIYSSTPAHTVPALNLSGCADAQIREKTSSGRVIEIHIYCNP